MSILAQAALFGTWLANAKLTNTVGDYPTINLRGAYYLDALKSLGRAWTL